MINLGYARVFVNCVWVAVLYLGVAAGATVLDRWLGRVRALDATEGGSVNPPD